MSNEWLFIAPSDEIFTVLCGSVKYQLYEAVVNYTCHHDVRITQLSTLYALSSITQNNSKEDVLPLASVDLDLFNRSRARPITENPFTGTLNQHPAILGCVEYGRSKN
jgi:hypothetical protein